MRKVKDYQRRDVRVLREQSGRLPVTSNDSQFTMFTKRERAIAVYNSVVDSGRRFSSPLTRCTLPPRSRRPDPPTARHDLTFASGLTGQVDLASRARAAGDALIFRRVI